MAYLATTLSLICVICTITNTHGYLDKRLWRRSPQTVSNIDTIKLELVNKFNAQSDAPVSPLSGLTVMHGRVYVVFKGSSVISVFDGKTFAPLEPLELTDPYDPTAFKGFENIISCNEEQSLFIQDNDWTQGKMIIWKLSMDEKSLTPWKEEPITMTRDVTMTGHDCSVMITSIDHDKGMTLAAVYNTEGIQIRNLPIKHSQYKPKSVLETIDGTFVMIDAADNIALDMNQRGAIVRSLGRHDKDKNPATINWPESGVYDKFGNLFLIDTYQDAVAIVSRDVSKSRIVLPGGDNLYRKFLVYDVIDERLFVTSQFGQPNVYVYKLHY